MSDAARRPDVAALAEKYRRDGGVLDDELEADAAAEVARRIEDQRESRWRAVCPQRFHLATLEWVEAEHGHDVVARLAKWAATRPRPNLVLLGPVGTGKTGAALSICRPDWFDHGLAVQFWPIVELLDALRPDGDADVAGLAAVPRLILDDLGSEKSSEWTAERLYAVVNRRWLEERPTIVTSNLQPDALAEVVGERLFSRLVGDDATVVSLLGSDRRRT